MRKTKKPMTIGRALCYAGFTFLVFFALMLATVTVSVLTGQYTGDEQPSDMVASASPAPSQVELTEPSPTPTSILVDDSTSADLSVSYDSIYQEYKLNELRADDAYKGNRYRITGAVNGMATGGLLNWNGGATLTIEVRVGNTRVFLYAEFEKDQETALKTINVGDTITFDGECQSWGSWAECELVTE